MNCSVKDCNNGRHALGLCQNHYMTAYRLRKSGKALEVDPAISSAIPEKFPNRHCLECGKAEIHGKNLCGTHYARLLRARKKKNARL